MTNDKHDVIADLTLSGTGVIVGIYSHAMGESIYFKTDENVEPIYISVPESDLMIAALRAAKHRIKKQEV